MSYSLPPDDVPSLFGGNSMFMWSYSILIIVQIAISYIWKQLASKIFSINFQQNVRSKTPSLKSLYEKKGVHELSNFSCFLCSIVSYWKSWTLTRCSKGGFFSESEIRFSNLPISQKNYSKKLSWAWNLNKLFTDMGKNFKFQAQDSFLE